ncbi:MAG: (2Fe-2S)-binding protein [Moraxella sp.]|nr:(2Fe-2S)-binding protein [Moraxella sp.]
MYVCICHDIKDTQIKTAMQQGLDTMESLQSTLQVATCCGCCEPMVQDLLDEHHSKFKSLGFAVDVMAS